MPNHPGNLLNVRIFWPRRRETAHFSLPLHMPVRNFYTNNIRHVYLVSNPNRTPKEYKVYEAPFWKREKHIFDILIVATYFFATSKFEYNYGFVVFIQQMKDKNYNKKNCMCCSGVEACYKNIAYVRKLTQVTFTNIFLVYRHNSDVGKNGSRGKHLYFSYGNPVHIICVCMCHYFKSVF